MVGWLWFLIIFVLIAGFATYVVLSSKKAIDNNETTGLMKLWKKDPVKSIASSLISIVFGLVIGCILLIIITLFPTKGTILSFGTAIDGIQLIFAGIFNVGKNASGELLFGFD